MPSMAGSSVAPSRTTPRMSRRWPRARRAGRDEQGAETISSDPDRDVDQEDPAPGPVGHEQPAQDRADDPADREDAGEQADGPVPVPAEDLGHDPGGRRHERAAADGLRRAQHDQQVDVAGEAAAQRRRGEQHGGAEEDPLAAVLIAELPGQRHHQDLAEGVDGDGPAAPVDLRRAGRAGGRAARWRRWSGRPRPSAAPGTRWRTRGTGAGWARPRDRWLGRTRSAGRRLLFRPPRLGHYPACRQATS